MAGIAVSLWIAWPWLPIAPDAAGLGEAGDCRAAGRHRRQLLADDDRRGHDRDRARAAASARLVLAVVVLADLVVLVLFSFAMQFARVARRRDGAATASACSRASRGRSAARSRSACWSARCSRSICATSAAR